ncbi:C25 family cysteine peptidase [Ekhidna sp.]|uniref:putative type IX secretion system sortase PorU2 n=1 Tax=Ekhidna sp. TaxID=2608089 RepID=UPI003CCC27F2
MWRISIILLLFSFCSTSVAQIGNEWIDFSQSYYKVKVGEDGFYRITRAELASIGFPVETVPKNRIQLFRRGQEVALNVNTGFTFEWLEFYGQRNDGQSDAPIYDAGDQPHTYYNLFTDTASYFLTYKLGDDDGSRMDFSADKNTTGLTPESFHIEDSLQLYTNSYASGVRFGSGSAFSLSKYDDGEGWTGSFQSKNVSRDFNFTLENYDATGNNPIIEMVLVGGNSLSHNVSIEVGPDVSSLGALSSVAFSGWGKQFFSGSLNSGNIGANGEFVVRVTPVGFPEAADRIAVSYIRLRYPQSIQMEDDENKVFTISNPTSSKAWLQIATTNAEGTRIFDVTDSYNPVRLATTNFSDRVEVVVPNVNDGQIVLAVSNVLSVASIEPVNFPEFDLSNKNYLIVTHPLLRTSGDPVTDYKNYRESVDGGGHNVQVANIDDLYNLYSYGDPTPLAIRNFIVDANNQNDVQNVFLIGKGFTPNFNYYRGDQTSINVPTYGYPGSDLAYTLGIDSDPNLPGIGVGRLNALNTGDVTAYLNKIIEMEALPYDDLFRKDFLQLSGGINAIEIATFINIVQGFTDILEADFVGGRAFNTGKETSEAVEYVDVTDRVNKGVGYITFFGHSSGTVTDIEIGRVGDPSFGFANKGKYPIFLVNGCQAGEIFGNNFTFGEDWMMTPELGAVGFMAHSNVALSSTLKLWSDLFYDVAFGTEQFIDESLGNVIVEVSRRYLAQSGTNNIGLTQIQQMTLQGDPAYRVFGADSPDYQIDENAITAEAFEANEILASQDSFKIEMVVKNFGRTVLDSLIVQVNRTLPDGGQEVYVQRYERPLRQDTLEITIYNDPTKNIDGSNLITVILDPENEVEEIDESNNSATLDLTIFSGNTLNLFPVDNAVLASNEVTFKWQSSDLLEENRGYQLEIDTQADFSGPNNRKFTVEGAVLIDHTFDFSALALPDTSTVYWRTRYATTAPDETNEWVSSSFTLVDNVEEGWGQYEFEQIDTQIISGISYNEVANRWEFDENITALDVFTYGADNSTFTYDDLQAIIGGVDFFVTSNTIDPFCQTNTFNAIAFDKESADPYRPITTTQIDVFNREVCGRIPQRIYQFREQDMIGSERRFQVLVDNMRDGDMIVLFNIGNVDYSNWDAEVENTLNTLGVGTATINSLTDGQPVIILGRKGDPQGSAIVISDDGSGNPKTEQSLDYQAEVVGRFVSGNIRTTKIGPAKNWEAFSYNITEEANDDIQVDVFGIDKNGNATTLASRARAETIDIASVDPVLYPEIELLFSFFDETDQTPPQLNFWELNYDYPPEGILQVSEKNALSIQEGEEISRSFYFYNLGTSDFTDSLSVMASLINQGTGEVFNSSFLIAPPLSGDTTSFSVNFSSFDKEGMNSLIVEVIPIENEAYQANNRLTIVDAVEVNADETNPILDVTFDGYHILDGDIVSPNPRIVIKMRDDNPFISKTDTTGINISLKLPGEESQFQRINFTDPRLTYTVASESEDFQIEFNPGPLGDGIHSIRIQAEDEAGNQAGTEPYEVGFEVVNESTITHFYPYPNPFSTSCRFVFTLTGSQIPDEIKIQILTVSGRVVREITQDEIGPIRVGNNITSYAWDGRDENGDQLANGVYFYKVLINANGNALERRSTSADKAFKHGFGKLYILR